MGEHRRERLTAIQDWFAKRHGSSDRRSLDHIYSREYAKRWRPRPLEADFVKQIDGKYVYVDIFGLGDDWRAVLGKALCYTANGEGGGQDYEVWLVTDLGDDPKLDGLSDAEKAEKISGWKMFFRDQLRLMKISLRPEIFDRVRILHSIRSGKELVLRDIEE